MSIKDFFLPQIREKRNNVQVNEPVGQHDVSDALRIGSIAVGFSGTSTFAGRKLSFEESEHDLYRITKAIDTDSYVREAFEKHNELFWKEGWSIVGENPDAVNYVLKRIDYMEMAMGRPFQDFLYDVVDQLVKYGNVFIVKGRDKDGLLGRYFPGIIDESIIGYYILPTEDVEILRDKHNKPISYRQRISGAASYMAKDLKGPTWDAKDIIHLYSSRKPGKAFGTPFVSVALDDVISLRQIEEDILNLIHRELFPLYKYKIGTENVYPKQEDIDRAAADLESLRTEGGIVIPNFHDIDIIGTNGEMLDALGYLSHFKERVAVGLGIYPHHLGMSGNAANRSMTDRLDVSTYDKVKKRQEFFVHATRYYIFNELLVEGGFNPIVNPAIDGDSDRCYIKFNEIDVDTQVKKQTHIIQKVISGIEQVSEGRMELGLPVDFDETDTIVAQNARLRLSFGKDAVSDPEKVEIRRPTSGSTNKSVGNIIRPSNQYGTRTSPDIVRWDNGTIGAIMEALGSGDLTIDQLDIKDYIDDNKDA